MWFLDSNALLHTKLGPVFSINLVVFSWFPDGASKHALQAFCDSLRNENAKNNIEVLVVSPSYVKTNIAVSSLSGQGSKVGSKFLSQNNTASKYFVGKEQLYIH